MYVLRLDVLANYRKILFFGSGATLFLGFLGTLYAMERDSFDFHDMWFGLVFLIGGTLFTGASFAELNDERARTQYLNLPASSLEKFISKWLITAPIFVIVAILFYWLFTVLLAAFTNYWFDFSFPAFQPFNTLNWLLIRIYLVGQTVFLVGAIYFRGFDAAKTVLLLVLVGMLLWLVGGATFRIAFWEVFDGLVSIRPDVMNVMNDDYKDFITNDVWPLLQKIFWFGVAPLFLVVGYFKIKETEV